MNHRERQALDRHITGNYGEDQMSAIDECNHNWIKITETVGDASIPNGTYDYVYFRCTGCGAEEDSEPFDYAPEEPDEDVYMDKIRGIDP